MANRKKKDDERNDTAIQVRVPSAFKARLDEMADATGVSISERMRTALLTELEAWERTRKKP